MSNIIFTLDDGSTITTDRDEATESEFTIEDYTLGDPSEVTWEHIVELAEWIEEVCPEEWGLDLTYREHEGRVIVRTKGPKWHLDALIDGAVQGSYGPFAP